MTDQIRQTAKLLLAAHDQFMSGKPMTTEMWELHLSFTDAAIFAAAAYEHAPCKASGAAALARAFLLALVDPAHHELDYLRTDPASGQVARDAATALAALTGEGGE